MEMKIVLTVNDEGRFSIETTEGMPTFTALGILEVGKKVMMEGAQDEEMPDMQEDSGE